MIHMPMLNPSENVIGQRAEEKARARDAEKAAATRRGLDEKVRAGISGAAMGGGWTGGDRSDRHLPKKGSASGGGRTTYKTARAPSLHEQIAAAARGEDVPVKGGSGSGSGVKKASQSSRSVFDLDAEIEKLDVGGGRGIPTGGLSSIAKGPDSRAAETKAAAMAAAALAEAEAVAEAAAATHPGIAVVEAGNDGAFEI
jgi:hypothetical protein